MITIKKDYHDLHLCCVLFACVGVGYLFPFSALTQPVDYWKKVFPDRNIEFPLVTLYMWINLFCLFIVVFCVKRYLCYLIISVLVFFYNITILPVNHRIRSAWSPDLWARYWFSLLSRHSTSYIYQRMCILH